MHLVDKLFVSHANNSYDKTRENASFLFTLVSRYTHIYVYISLRVIPREEKRAFLILHYYEKEREIYVRCRN